MSVKVMGLVWDLKISREEKFILLAYADHADHEGGSIFPAISTIAEKTGYSKRSVQRVTRKLEVSGYLVAISGQKGGVGITAHWCIPMKDDKIAPLPKGDNSGSERVTLTTPKGDIATSPDPSINHQVKPSEEPEEEDNIFRLYESSIGLLTKNISDELKTLEDDYPKMWIDDAFAIAKKNKATHLKYVTAILMRWNTNGKDDGYKPQGKKKGVDLSAFDRRRAREKS